MDYAFGQYTLSTSKLQLLKDDAPLALEPQVFALLKLLIENADRVVTKDEIFDEIWKGKIVSDAALSSRIKVARAAIGDDGSRQDLIRTVHGRGFHFVGEVTKDADDAAPEPLAKNDRRRPGLVVLPAEMLAPNEEQRAFGDGLVHDLSTALGRIRSLYVAATQGGLDPRRIATELSVRYLLQIRMRFSGNSYRLNAALLDSQWMEEVWADSFSGKMEDVFEAQDRLSAAVMGALVPNIFMVEVRRAADAFETDKSAYSYFLRAIPLCWTALKKENLEAIDHIEKALDLDDNYALAHALMSWLLGQKIVYVWTDNVPECRKRAMYHAQRALKLAPRDSMVLTFVANAETSAREHASAEHHIRTALELDPNSAWAWSRLGYIHIFQDRAAEGREAFQKSLELSPHDPMRHSVYFGLAASYFAEQDYATALRWLDQALIENPEKVSVHRLVAACSAELGDFDRARQSVKILRDNIPRATAESLAASVPLASEDFHNRLVSSYKKAGL